METLATIVILIVMLTGLAGTIVPAVPGIGMMWIASIIYGFWVGWDSLGIVLAIIITIITVAAMVAGFVLPKRAASDAGAATWSQWAAVLGAIIGFFIIPVIGIVIGALVGIGIAEYLDKGDWDQARTSTIAVAKGFGVSALVQFGLGAVIVLVWAAWAALTIF